MKAKKTFEILWDESAGKELKNLLKEIQVKSELLSKKIKNGILEIELTFMKHVVI